MVALIPFSAGRLQIVVLLTISLSFPSRSFGLGIALWANNLVFDGLVGMEQGRKFQPTYILM